MRTLDGLVARLPVAGLAPDGAGVSALALLRAALVFSFATTVAYTWPLWADRSEPFLAPAHPDLPSLPMGALILVALAVVLFRPREGVAVVWLVFVVAVAMDQRRLQPEFVSFLLLMTATLGGGGGRLIGWAHLTSLWFWAGFNKVLSGGWPSVAGSLSEWSGQPGLEEPMTWAIPGLEIFTGLMVLSRRTRPVAVVAAVLMHVGILLVLSPLGDGEPHNLAVWPWNLVLAPAAVVLLSDRLDPRRVSLRGARPASIAVAFFLVVQPAFFYVGLGDAYLAHHLYTGNLRDASVCLDTGQCRYDIRDRGGTNVPLPPEPRIYVSLFEQGCEPGERLVIREPNIRIGPFDREIESERPCPSGDP